MHLQQLIEHFKQRPHTSRMPALFIGHGSPMNALPNSPYYQSWNELGSQLTQPQAILCISAHWTTSVQTKISTSLHPETIYDFYNFPSELYQQNYPALGAPELALEISQRIKGIETDASYGLDHGAWCIIKPMFPDANVPVFQLSIAMRREPRYHYELGQALRFLRHKAVLIISSGNIVHNLRTMRFDGSQLDWAIEFDVFSAEKINQRDDNALIDFQQWGQAAQLSINSAEHYYPLLYTLGLREESDEIMQFNTTLEGASISMRSVLIV